MLTLAVTHVPLRVQIANVSTHKTCFTPKLQKRAPANNYHHKVHVDYT